MSFHAPITTLSQWNAALGQCGCCEMRECETPVLECQAKNYVPCVFFVDTGSGIQMWKKRRTGAADEDITVETRSGQWLPFEDFYTCDEEITTDPPEEEAVNEYLEPVTCEDMTAALAALVADYTGEFVGDGCAAIYQCYPLSANVAVAAVRYRWRVPPCHPGSWYRIDWDEVFFPQAYLDWLADAQADPDGIEVFDPNANPPPVLPTITPKSWTWTGAALGPCDYDDPENDYDYRFALASRISPWSLDVIPPAPGIVELRNARVQCYRNPFGTVSQPVSVGLESYDPGDVDQDSIPDDDEPIPEP